MLSVMDLQLGFSDAENYRRRENKELFNRLFIRNQHLDRLCEPAISFLIGEKGTGKTAYAVYLSNNNYRDTLSSLRYIRETEYQKFLSLKREKQLTLSDYANIWKVIILVLMSQQVKEREGGVEFFQRFTKMSAVQRAIDDYYSNAFAPEIIQALQFVEESKIGAELLSKYAKLGGEAKESLSFSESRFQTNLFYIQRQFEAALSQLRLGNNHILFIDGIDIRPESIAYGEYLECIKGLANAIWEVNNDFFPTVKGKGRMRAVLLVRPDIFQSLGLQNQNTKGRDNSVFLDWRTEYVNHRESDLFRVTDHLLGSQQSQPLDLGEAWDHYFPWNAHNLFDTYDTFTSFIAFLRWSYYRPRDIVTMLVILQKIAREQDNLGKMSFSGRDFDSPDFRRQYSDYLLGELKDHLIFYYGLPEYEAFLKFFEYLKGREMFDYSFYLEAFKTFKAAIEPTRTGLPQFMTSADVFLQFLYDLNVVCYRERPQDDKPYVRWCFRERSYGNISPKVKANVEYQVFYGLAKALNVGKQYV